MTTVQEGEATSPRILSAEENAAAILNLTIQILQQATPCSIQDKVGLCVQFLQNLVAQCTPPAEPAVEAPVAPVEAPVEPVPLKPLPPRLAHFENARQIGRAMRDQMTKEEVLKAKAAGHNFEKLVTSPDFEEAKRLAKERREQRRLEREAKKNG